MDPEVPVSLVDLGLIYEVRRLEGRVEVELSFTATACPAMDFIQEDIRERLLAEPGVEEVKMQVVWEPPWTPDRISETGRKQLKDFGISL
jgi:metal-sulfur cluster biosynthetic enzyme